MRSIVDFPLLISRTRISMKIIHSIQIFHLMFGFFQQNYAKLIYPYTFGFNKFQALIYQGVDIRNRNEIWFGVKTCQTASVKLSETLTFFSESVEVVFDLNHPMRTTISLLTQPVIGNIVKSTTIPGGNCIEYSYYILHWTDAMIIVYSLNRTELLLYHRTESYMYNFISIASNADGAFWVFEIPEDSTTVLSSLSTYMLSIPGILSPTASLTSSEDMTYMTTPTGYSNVNSLSLEDTSSEILLEETSSVMSSERQSHIGIASSVETIYETATAANSVVEMTSSANFGNMSSSAEMFDMTSLANSVNEMMSSEETIHATAADNNMVEMGSWVECFEINQKSTEEMLDMTSFEMASIEKTFDVTSSDGHNIVQTHLRTIYKINITSPARYDVTKVTLSEGILDVTSLVNHGDSKGWSAIGPTSLQFSRSSEAENYITVGLSCEALSSMLFVKANDYTYVSPSTVSFKSMNSEVLGTTSLEYKEMSSLESFSTSTITSANDKDKQSFAAQSKTPPLKKDSFQGDTQPTQFGTFEVPKDEVEDKPSYSRPDNLTDDLDNLKECDCTCYDIPVNITSIKQNIKISLYIDYKSLSRVRRKYICIPDNRPTAISLGAIGIAVLILLFLIMACSDIHRVAEIKKSSQIKKRNRIKRDLLVTQPMKTTCF